MSLSLQHIRHDDINRSLWDKAILASEVPTVFAQTYFLDATSPKWDALVINDYETVFPLTWKRKLGITYLPQPYFTGQLGAFGKIDQEREQAFYEYILKRYKLIEIELNSSNQLESRFNEPKNTFVIDYAEDFSYNQNTKRNIAKAQAAGMKVEQVPEEQVLDLSEKILIPFLASDLKIPAPELEHFRSLLKNCMANKALLSLKSVDREGQVKALGHFVYNKRYAVFMKGTNIDKSDNSGSMHLLVAHAIDHFRNRCEWFDFGGGSLHEGLAGFYKGLGGTKRDYHLLRVNHLPVWIKLLKRSGAK